ncbi:hypothetical protein OIDMADRAFT_59851 [Oidiodendron maius Zn]|uniref:Uncharacterized protein n=1 Tax=Oidiodendron maius (strain Zn) TaxID=913774 RepID=A0A0C3C8Y9_OIDMZ|nr:hypothetical protein OIDMADRAFT_59851 [Oidiodendron maius Zn]
MSRQHGLKKGKGKGKEENKSFIILKSIHTTSTSLHSSELSSHSVFSLLLLLPLLLRAVYFRLVSSPNIFPLSASTPFRPIRRMISIDSLTSSSLSLSSQFDKPLSLAFFAANGFGVSPKGDAEHVAADSGDEALLGVGACGGLPLFGDADGVLGL